MKRLFRYKQSSRAILLGLIIAFISMFYGDFLYQLKDLELSEEEAFSYENQFAFSIDSRDLDLDYLAGLLQQESVMAMADAVRLYVDASYGECWCNVVFSQGEGMKLPLCEGRYPTEEELQRGEPVVVLGKTGKEKTYQRDGADYILIDGEEYRVTGYCSGIRTTIANRFTILFYPCLGERVKEDLLSAGETYSIVMTLNSDGTSVNPLYERVKNGLEEQGYRTGGLSEYPSFFFTSQYRENHQWFAYLIYGFCLFIIIVILQYWLYQRNFEFAIRRIYGYTRLRLVGYIGKELGGLLLLSGCIAVVLYGGIGLVYYFWKDILLADLWITALRTIGIIMVTFILLMIYPMWNIYRQQAMEAYRNG